MAADSVVKNHIDFPWQDEINPVLGQLLVSHCWGDVLDVGCGTCTAYRHLKKNGWSGNYVGIDMVTYDKAKYPESATVIIGDALAMDLPKSDTCVLHDVLEHVEDPVALLRKCVDGCKNVLVAVPKRNEELWRFGIAEYHQLDKTHKHWGFTQPELRLLVERSGGRMVQYKELFATELMGVLTAFTTNEFFIKVVENLVKAIPTQSYAQELWCVVSKA